LEQQAGLEAQVEQLTRAGVEKLFTEQVSSMGQRKELEAALDFVREGDVFVVTTLSRLARSVSHLWQIVQRLEDKKVTLRILDMGIDTGNPTGRLLLTLIGGIVQWEREIMLERQREGIRKAHKEGKYRGRVPTARRQTDKIIKLKEQGTAPSDIAKTLKISRASVYRILAENPLSP
jgi:DNA invertase Pin-like site-specific DNA recombinase